MERKEKDSTAIVAHSNQAISVDEIRNFIMSTDTLRAIPKVQQDLAIQIAHSFNLNPFKKEAHFVPYQGKITLIVGYEVYLKRAEETNKLNGWDFKIEGQGNDTRGVITIWRKDWDHPFIHETYMVEARQNSPLWTKQPRFMLKKTTIGQGFRLAFPKEMGGMPYMEEELPPIHHETAPSQPHTLAGQVEDLDSPASTTAEMAEQIQVEAVPQQGTTEAVEDVSPICEECGKVITAKVAAFSKGRFGKSLCMTHQKGAAV